MIREIDSKMEKRVFKALYAMKRKSYDQNEIEEPSSILESVKGYSEQEILNTLCLFRDERGIITMELGRFITEPKIMSICFTSKGLIYRPGKKQEKRALRKEDIKYAITTAISIAAFIRAYWPDFVRLWQAICP